MPKDQIIVIDMRKIKVIFLMFFVCSLTEAQEKSETIKDNKLLNELLVKHDSKTYVYKYFVPIKFLKPMVSNVNFIDKLYGSCNSLNHLDFKLNEFIKSNKDSFLENIDRSSFTKVKKAGLNRRLKLTTNHSKKSIVYISKPIYFDDLIFVYFYSKDESKILFLDKLTFKVICSKYLYLSIDN